MNTTFVLIWLALGSQGQVATGSASFGSSAACATARSALVASMPAATANTVTATGATPNLMAQCLPAS